MQPPDYRSNQQNWNTPAQPAFSGPLYGQTGQTPPPPAQMTPPTPKKSWFKRPVKMPAWLFLLVLIAAIGIGAAIGGGNSNAASPTANTNQASANTATVSTPVAKQSPTPTPKPQTLQTTHTYSGNGSNKTSTFTIAGNDWKILWSCSPNSFEGISYNVAVDVDVPGQDFPADPGVINTLCSPSNKSGSTEEYKSGTFYLNIDSEAAWTIKVQELK